MEKAETKAGAAPESVPERKDDAKPDGAVPGEAAAKAKDAPKPDQKIAETGGPKGPEPTRFGDWERGGICVDF